MKEKSFGALYAVDDLNRLLPTAEQVGGLKKDRVVGVFYFPKQGMGVGQPKKGEKSASMLQVLGRPTAPPCNVTKVLKEHPEAVHDYDHPAWGDGALYWDEPLFGYYFMDDRWVLRRQIKLLTAAGVDFLIFDTTNRVTFWKGIRILLEELEAYRKEGWNVPKIVYYTNTQSGATVQELWEDLYGPGLFRDLWFEWEGKPLIIAEPDQCTEEQRAFFTFRLPQWPTEKPRRGGCPWIDFQRPQRAWLNEKGENEIVPVSTAQHPSINFGAAALYGDPVSRGRNFHSFRNDKTPEAGLYGYNVAEQWERAIELDPKMVFFTGWNEWSVSRRRNDEDDREPLLMVDQADTEFSRDVEPMRGGHFDNYYMQLCDYIRRYKGAPPMPEAQPVRELDMDAGFDQWEDVPAYWAMPFGTIPRKAEGHGGVIYEDHTGRNEFECLKVAHDAENVYFYARTREDIVFNMFTKFMTLFIGIKGRPYAPHWHGYHYLVNDVMLDGVTTFVQRCLGGFRWGDNTRAAYRKEGRELMLRIPRSLLGVEKDGFELYFQWADHTGKNEIVEDFYLHGDTAPYGRFSYIYRAK